MRPITSLRLNMSAAKIETKPMVIYRCPRGHTKGEADYAKRMTGEPTCSACIDLNWPLCFMKRMEVREVA